MIVKDEYLKDRSTFNVTFELEGEKINFLLTGNAAERAKKLKDVSIDEAIKIAIEEDEKNIQEKINEVHKFLFENDYLSKKNIKKHYFEILKNAGKRLLYLKELVDSFYGSDENAVLSDPLKPYLFELGIAENSARKYMYLALYEVKENHKMLGTDLVFHVIEDCRAEGIDDVNSVLDKCMEKTFVDTDDESEIKKHVTQYLNFKKFKRKADKKNIPLPDSTEDAFLSGTNLQNTHLKQMASMNDKEKKEYIKEIICNGGSNSVHPTDNSLSIDYAVSLLKKLLIEDQGREEKEEIDLEKAEFTKKMLEQKIDQAKQKIKQQANA